MANQRDIEYEMSKFEEEITKLIPSATSSTATHHGSYNITTSTIKQSKINIQMPTTLPNSTSSNMLTNNYPPYPIQPPPPPISMPVVNPFINPIPHRATPKAPAAPSASVPSTGSSNTGGVKRDSTGTAVNTNQQVANKPSQKAAPPTTAAAVATQVAAASAENDSKAKKAKEAKDKKKKKIIRAAGGQTWEDETLLEWDTDDFRLFCGDLGNEVNDESLTRAFAKYPSFIKAKVVRDKRTGKTKGYGFVSFKNSDDFIKAMREMDGKYVGNRPIKLRKSNWKDRNLDAVRRKEAEKQKMGLR